jgi:hypothetical protein
VVVSVSDVVGVRVRLSVSAVPAPQKRCPGAGASISSRHQWTLSYTSLAILNFIIIHTIIL